MVNLPFKDRTEAGCALGAELATRKLGPKPIVLALPRGGLPLGVEVAARLKAPLDIVVVRKLGVPWQPELAMGAIAGETRVLEADLIRTLGIPKEDVDAVVARETAEMERREKLYRGGLPGPDLRQRTVVLVDDGLATGSTMTAAARHVRSFQPLKLVIAVPVASSRACSRVKKEADECVCLAEPEPFAAVGEWYVNFPQVSDAEVQAILEHTRHQAQVVA
jgi:putative phosphoribosyl transferase